MNKFWNDKTVFVSGHRGMVGSAICRELERQGADDVLVLGRETLDLGDTLAVREFVGGAGIDRIYLAAAKVGGIHANDTYPAEFLYENLMIQNNVVHAAHVAGVSRLLFLGSSCIYPKLAPQPIAEDSLLSGPLEPTNEAYAIAKIAGIKMCDYYREQYGCNYISAMPTNLYGPGDNYHPQHSHVLPALLKRFHDAKNNGDESVTIWGTGSPRREFLHVDDLADGLLHLCTLENPPDLVNVGTGSDVTILELATMVAKVVGYAGQIKTDPDKPDGTPVKRTDMTLMHSTGWTAKTDLEAGLKRTYESFLAETGQGVLREV